MRTIIFFLGFLAFCPYLFAQQSVGLTLSLGGSMLPVSRNWTNQISRQNLPAPSGNIGLFYNKNLGEKFLLGGEVLFSQIGTRENLEYYLTDRNDNLTGEIQAENSWSHLSCMSLPLFFGIRFRQLTVHLGVRSSFFFETSEQVTVTVRDPSGAILSNWEQRYKDLSVRTRAFDFGPRIGCYYPLSSRFSLEANYYHGVTSLETRGTWKVRQAVVGLRYTFLSE